MSLFATARAALTDAVFAAFGEADCLLTPADGGDARLVRAIVRTPAEAETIEKGQFIASRPVLRTPCADGTLRKGDIVDVPDPQTAVVTRWKINGAPRRPGDGRHWEATVDKIGVVE